MKGYGDKIWKTGDKIANFQASGFQGSIFKLILT